MSDKIHNKQKNKKNVYDIQGGEQKVMKKSTKKVINVAASAALLAGVAPVAGIIAPTAAHASGSFDVISVPTISGNSTESVTELGRVRVNVFEDTLNDGTATTATYKYLTVTLPEGLELKANANLNSIVTSRSDVTTTGGNNVIVSAAERVGSSNKTFRIGVKGTNQDDDFNFQIDLANQVRSTGLTSGDLNLSFTADPNSGLPTGNVKFATVVTSGQVALEARETQSSSEDFAFTLRVTESVAASLRDGNAIKLKLPSGFDWSAAGTATALYGDLDNEDLNISIDDDTLTIATKSGVRSTSASSFDLPLTFSVDDEDQAKDGDVTASISGNSSLNVSSLVVGTYGEYGGGVTIASPTTVTSGQDEQQIGDVVIKETVAGSFLRGRTVTLQLPEGARWQTVYEDGKGATGSTGSVETANGLTQPNFEYSGTDGRTLRLTWPTGTNDTNGGKINTSNRAGSITLKDVEIAVQPGFTGDVNLTVAGSQGLTGTVKAATATNAVTLTATNATYNVAIGTDMASIGDLTLKEGAAGALTDDNGNDVASPGLVEILLPSGVTFGSTPTVSVTSGDLRIRNVSIDTYQNSTQGVLRFYVDSESTTASTISINGVNLRIDRTVPQGDIVAKVQGPAASYTAYNRNNDVTSSWYDSNRAATQAAIATIGTAPADQTDNAVTAIYTIGSTAYSVNGTTRTAEVAPYVENGRTYLPVRYVAEALGVSQANILFDKATSMVTLIKGDRVVQLKLKTNQLTINGSTINMDVKAVTKANRTVLPIAWVGKALDATVQYDAAAKTVTVTSK
ncbi:copper amine oxidase N-terminal domain-containing protein [Paenibacillus bovis]|uniref:Copper amine oxidase n=1 Tax=Paenibacillus bovis TaxID=1616788 RepID=A0A172ZLT0_9BACL|nr:copper amine oxidase N-terminal domain-containing protein [Paenibacillus bovis]ANF98503.1 copper amine oxidase [Paenibacillus bovis]